MIRTCLTIALLAATLPQAEAQRLDGCTSSEATTSQETTMTHVSIISKEARALALQNAGYALTKESVTSALADPRPDVRSLAAQQSVAEWPVKVLNPVVQAWASETDTCTRAGMQHALNELAWALA